MSTARGLFVWAVGGAVVLGAFFAFAATGWPGAADGCLARTPDTCFCEAIDAAAVLGHAAGVRQPINTWINLYAVITSLIVALSVTRDRRALAGRRPANLMRSASTMPDVLIFATQFLGLGSMWFHASITSWGGVVDGLSMYLFAAFLPFYSLRRIHDSGLVFWIGWPATALLFTLLHHRVPSVVNIGILVAGYAIVEVAIWIRTGAVMQGRAKTRALWLGAVAAILVATVFWALSQTGGPLCDPASPFQPHGMLWHPLAGVTAVLLYCYWREATDPVRNP